VRGRPGNDAARNMAKNAPTALEGFPDGWRCRLAEERPKARGSETRADVDALAMLCRSVCAGVSRGDEMGWATRRWHCRPGSPMLYGCSAAVLLSCSAGCCRQAGRQAGSHGGMSIVCSDDGFCGLRSAVCGLRSVVFCSYLGIIACAMMHRGSGVWRGRGRAAIALGR
jgi:hypothetical protein